MSQLNEVLDSFFNVAAATCASILTQPPDLVIVPMHAGRFSLLAAQALWDQIQTEPFPPVLPVNIGSEKSLRYSEICDGLGFRSYDEQNIDAWEGSHAYKHDHRETGHMLAWVLQQDVWAESLAERIEGVLGRGCQPQRILVIDDFIDDGQTCLITLGLLRRLYPNTKTEVLAATISLWREDVVAAWLKAKGLEALGDQLKQTPYYRYQGTYRSTHTHLDLFKWLVPGTEDVENEPLSWRPLQPTNRYVAALRPYLGFQECLALSQWVAQAVVNHAERHAAQFDLDGAYHIRVGRLLPQQMISAHMWLYGCTSVADTAAWAQLSEEETTEIMDHFVKDEWAVWREQNGVRCCDLIRSGVLLYGVNAESPGPDLEVITERVSTVMTPFPVEFVRANGVHGPYLVPVAERMGARIPATLLQLQPDVDEDEIAHRLTYVESRLWGGERFQYFENKEAKSDDPIHIQQIKDFGGLDRVFFAEAQPNIPETVDVAHPPQARAEHLTRVALQSFDATDEKTIDGITYLRACLAQGIQTPLLDLYVHALQSERPDLVRESL